MPKLHRDGPDPVDLYVGVRIRARRHELGLTQSALAQGLNVTFQQVQKYERGANRVSASMMVHAAKVLKVAPGWFFQGLPDTLEEAEAEDALAEWLASPEGQSWSRLGFDLDGPGYAVLMDTGRLLLNRQLLRRRGEAEIKPFHRKAS